ncbi:hypothetical protein N8I77_000604 [Diaporthe amygdali]|uniref:Uncharacterized protein n=1 Tax=Phomopsis amygdali TaxID=1214568 RepID=A0AAD9W7A4_PHOAM|nr:hypothetical protein N8I77_000604 [Diaporthe amygdali]
MNQQAPKKVPFTEDPTEHVLTQYANFTRAAYSPSLCEQRGQGVNIYLKPDEAKKGNNIHLVTEAAEKGEGLIERKDVYAFIHKVLKKQEQDLRGYWAIKAKHSPQDNKADTLLGEDAGSSKDKEADESLDKGLSLPVFQYGTLGLEVYPCDEGIINLGTWDVEFILRACLEFKKGQNIMPKLSGSGIYQAQHGQMPFRWSLRGPTIEPESDDGRVLKKFKSLFRK